MQRPRHGSRFASRHCVSVHERLLFGAAASPQAGMELPRYIRNRQRGNLFSCPLLMAVYSPRRNTLPSKKSTHVWTVSKDL